MYVAPFGIASDSEETVVENRGQISVFSV